jgi:hypothetical protein
VQDVGATLQLNFRSDLKLQVFSIDKMSAWHASRLRAVPQARQD